LGPPQRQLSKVRHWEDQSSGEGQVYSLNPGVIIHKDYHSNLPFNPEENPTVWAGSIVCFAVVHGPDGCMAVNLRVVEKSKEKPSDRARGGHSARGLQQRGTSARGTAQGRGRGSV